MADFKTTLEALAKGDLKIESLSKQLDGLLKKSPQFANKLLLQLDEATYSGGTMGKPHPIAWYREYDGGRAFYTGLGHTSASFEEPLF